MLQTIGEGSGNFRRFGKEAEKLIKSGIIQETIEEGDHKHVVVEFDNDFFWCTIENNGEKTCVLY